MLRDTFHPQVDVIAQSGAHSRSALKVASLAMYWDVLLQARVGKQLRSVPCAPPSSTWYARTYLIT